MLFTSESVKRVSQIVTDIDKKSIEYRKLPLISRGRAGGLSNFVGLVNVGGYIGGTVGA